MSIRDELKKIDEEIDLLCELGHLLQGSEAELKSLKAQRDKLRSELAKDFGNPEADVW